MKMYRSAPLFFSALALFLTANAYGVVWNSQVTDQDVLDFGNSTDFQGIGQVSFATSPNGAGFGTGTFIGFGDGYAWGITANHVVDGASGITFNFADGRSYDILQTYFIDQDVSIFRMATFASGVFAPTLNPAGAFSLGEDVQSAGYGLYGPEGTYMPDLGLDNQRRGWQSTISSSGNETFPGDIKGSSINIDYIETIFNSPISPDFRPYEGTTEPGDSGSPLMTSDGTILGVLTGGNSTTYSSYGQNSDFDMLSPSMVAQIGALTGVPEPASLSVLVVSGVVLLLRKRHV
jgi:hypothetical protein